MKDNANDFTAMLIPVVALLIIIVICLLLLGLDLSNIQNLLIEIRDRLPAVEAAP